MPRSEQEYLKELLEKSKSKYYILRLDIYWSQACPDVGLWIGTNDPNVPLECDYQTIKREYGDDTQIVSITLQHFEIPDRIFTAAHLDDLKEQLKMAPQSSLDEFIKECLLIIRNYWSSDRSVLP